MLGGEVVELHALVNFKRGGREGLARGGSGANVLAAVALDTGVGVEEAGPGEVFEFVCPMVCGFVRFVLGFEVESRDREDA